MHKGPSHPPQQHPALLQSRDMGKPWLYDMLEMITWNFSPKLIIYNGQIVFNGFLFPIEVRQSWHEAHKFCILNEAYLQGQQGFRFKSKESCIVNIVVKVPSWVNGESQQVHLESDSPPVLDINIYGMNHPSEILSLTSAVNR